jgi:hypothetical protein
MLKTILIIFALYLLIKFFFRIMLGNHIKKQGSQYQQFSQFFQQQARKAQQRDRYEPSGQQRTSSSDSSSSSSSAASSRKHNHQFDKIEEAEFVEIEEENGDKEKNTSDKT